jgi:hypothetical protein
MLFLSCKRVEDYAETELGFCTSQKEESARSLSLRDENTKHATVVTVHAQIVVITRT